MTANTAAAIAQTPAARPSIPSEKFTTFMTATSPTTVSGSPAEPKSTAPMNGNVMFVTSTPACTGMIAATDLPGELDDRRQVEPVVQRPDERDDDRSEQDAVDAVVGARRPVEEERGADEDPGEHRQTPEQRRRALGQAAVGRAVDGADRPRDAGRQRRDQHRHHERGGEAEEGVLRGHLAGATLTARPAMTVGLQTVAAAERCSYSG